MIGDDNLSMHVDIQAGPGLQQQQLTEEEAGLQLVEQAGLEAGPELSHKATRCLEFGNLEAAWQLTVGHCQGHEQLHLSEFYLGLAPMAGQELAGQAQTARPLGLLCRTLQRPPSNDESPRIQHLIKKHQH